MRITPAVLLLMLAGSCALAQAQSQRDGRKTALHSNKPDAEIVRLDIDGDGRPDILERWWNGKRVRWLDEAGTLRADDTRGDQINGLLQIDMDGDGQYDGFSDMNIKWCDTDGDGSPDVQAFVSHPDAPGKAARGVGAHWMLFINHDKRGVLGWMDWQKYKFDCWGRTDKCNWLPNYHGHCDFLKIHRSVSALEDPRLNWENPFSFYDFDGDGLSEMAMRWCDPYNTDGDKTKLTGNYNEAFVTYDLDNDSSRGIETAYDMSLRGAGGPGLSYTDMVHPLPHFKGNPKFNTCFQWNNWRQVSEVNYIPQSKQHETFFTIPWSRMYFVFDEDHDDHRWERVELYYPTAGISTNDGKADIYSTKRWPRRQKGVPVSKEPPGLSGHPQADSIGDRGEFDMDNSGKGQLYIGPFDRKFHLYGAEWGAWTVDSEARYHGGAAAPSSRPSADKVEEVVKYTDTDNNGYLDTIEYDHNGDRVVDFKVCLLDYKTPENPHPDVVPLIDTKKEGWKGLHVTFNATAQSSWIEAQQVYRAAWRRGLTTPELDLLMQASSLGQRYQQAYWIKEKVFRLVRDRLAERANTALEQNLTRAYYAGRFDEYVQLIGQVPAK